MLNVWCVLWGDKYPPAYVYALRDMVDEYLTVAHRFRCVTDHDLPGIETCSPTVDHPGWWQKIGLFDLPGGLFFDLDVVITGSIDYLEEYTRFEIAAPANWGQSGHGGIQSSVLAWSGAWREPVARFDYARDAGRLWGDQEYLTELRGDDYVRIPGVYSYKYHCRQGPPADASVVVFHGRPNPHEVAGWTLPYTRTLRSRINATMPNTCAPVSSATG